MHPLYAPPARRRRAAPLVGVALLSAVVGAAGGCDGEGPALRISLQVSEADGADIDTSNIQQFRLKLRTVDAGGAPVEDDVPFQARSGEQVEIECDNPPAGPTDIVLFACNQIAACQPSQAEFVGCTRANLQPSPDAVPVFVFLSAMPSAGGVEPPGCEGLLFD